ncbi:MAG: hypothetical protein EBU47_11610, partial [Betaproteobacteria bacterium]|nr:hypothetical protein [Betaproteobacteria bacterium]
MKLAAGVGLGVEDAGAQQRDAPGGGAEGAGGDDASAEEAQAHGQGEAAAEVGLGDLGPAGGVALVAGRPEGVGGGGEVHRPRLRQRRGQRQEGRKGAKAHGRGRMQATASM